MKIRILILAAAVVCIVSVSAERVPSKSNQAGQELAAELRNMPPVENSDITGVLKIRAATNNAEIPVRAQVVMEGDKWKTIYTTKPTEKVPATRIVVIHATNAPNEYYYSRANDSSSELPQPTPISIKAALETPFAGSDFTIGDLGLDFLHWPEQKRLTGELRLGRDCYLLESENPAAPEMVRVKLWIDKETGGLLVAQGYNAKGEKVKEFSLSGSSFKKVNGRMQLEKMTIYSPKKKSETVLRFDLPKD